MADQGLLDRPAQSPPQPQPGPNRADGYPTSNARGQYRSFLAPPAGTAAAAKIAQAQREIAAAEEAATAARAALAADAALETADIADDWNPTGWAIAAVGGVYALQQLNKLNQALKDKEKAEADLKAESGGGSDRTNVKVDGDDPCDLKPYNQNKCPNGNKHHVVADYVLRYGVRNSDTRIPNAPSLDEGLTICLSPSEHKAVHDIMDKAVANLGTSSSTGAGTAPMSQIVEEAIKALEKVKPECTGQLDDVRKQFENMGDQPGRTTKNPPAGGSPAQQTLQSGGAGGGTR